MKKTGIDKKTEARRLFEQDGLKLVEIAKKLELKASTVRAWKSKDKVKGMEWISPQAGNSTPVARSNNVSERCNAVADSPESNSQIKELFASYLKPEARAVFNAVSDRNNKLDLLEDMINIKFSNLVTAQQSIDYSDPRQSQADSIANRTLSNMIRDFYSIQSGVVDDSELSKVDLLLAEITREAYSCDSNTEIEIDSHD